MVWTRTGRVRYRVPSSWYDCDTKDSDSALLEKSSGFGIEEDTTIPQILTFTAGIGSQ